MSKEKVYCKKCGWVGINDNLLETPDGDALVCPECNSRNIISSPYKDSKGKKNNNCSVCEYRYLSMGLYYCRQYEKSINLHIYSRKAPDWCEMNNENVWIEWIAEKK
jgi:hypothetical protein